MADAVQILPASLNGIEQSVERARALFSEGDVLKARIVADAAYAQAKTEAEFAAKHGCARHLIDKARRLMADALIIEQTSLAALSDLVDGYQRDGLVAKGGRPSLSPDSTRMTLKDLGVDRKRLFDARKVKNVISSRPDAVSAAVNARFAAGKLPSRAALMRDLGIRADGESKGYSLPGIPSLEKLHWYELPEAIREAGRVLAVLQRVYAHVQPEDHNLRVGDLIGPSALASLVEGDR